MYVMPHYSILHCFAKLLENNLFLYQNNDFVTLIEISFSYVVQIMLTLLVTEYTK